MFQHTAARRRLLGVNIRSSINTSVSTHSRTEAAADPHIVGSDYIIVSTHSRTEAAAENLYIFKKSRRVSTHSRTEAAAPSERVK